MVKTWDKYDSATMGVVVLNIKRCVCLSGSRCYRKIDTTSRSSLPDDVFDPGEKQKPILKRPIHKVIRLRYTFPGSAKGFPMVQGGGQDGQRFSRLA